MLPMNNLAGEQILDAIKPKFYVDSPEFYPVCANPAEDAGADLRANFADASMLANQVELRNCFYIDSYPVFVDGQRCYNYDDFIKDHGFKHGARINPCETLVISAGFRIALPDLRAYGPYKAVYKIVSRSGLSIKHGVCVINRPGIIDAGYRDYIKVGLENTRESIQIFTHGSRIAQGLYEVVFDQAAYPQEEVCVSLGEFNALNSSRGMGGLGSTKV